MPFNSDFDYIYGVIKQNLNDNGFICNRADEISGSKPILNKILMEILKSRYIIADLTNYNPNVFYELGIAHSFKDAQNILMIKQKNSKIPFDLTHLTYIEYDSKNLRFLTATIRKFIQENKYVSDFHETLNLCGITNLICESREKFIDYLQEYFGADIVMITNILNDRSDIYNDEELIKFYKNYESLILRLLKESKNETLDGLLSVYYNLLAHCHSTKIGELFVCNFLNQLFVYIDDMEEEILSWKTDLMLILAKRKKLIKIALPWIIDYFSRSKSSSIDLNRYKLESFLMTTNYTEINQMIIDSLFDSDCHIREHMADIIGEKRLYNGINALLKQLEREENYFTISSIIEAIGKIGSFSELKYILNWMEIYENKIIEQHQFFLLKHVYKAICRLDNTPDEKYAKIFFDNYSQYMNSYIVN